MTITASLFISLVILTFVIYLLSLIKHNKLLIKYSLSWVLTAVVILFFVWVPQSLLLLTKALGIYSPTNMLFFLGFCLSLCIIFSLTNTLSRQSVKIKTLTQELALLKKEGFVTDDKE
ncbi:DUF2304 domain-containing protein [Streptococcus cuniculipharyngis]|uniref:DUF2304 domain-containing protein n=1 Tax=Streptococcus cuniculipharyngis TaxID=1562651 RepID=A0A5C5SFP0_9STRE|nr:DUF2304 domain-containing protein [Streptococcus cuniculipharyngis]TWS98953.1 DUF2304 domain-containing protein [Streptococcus cuniculipharyngis]